MIIAVLFGSLIFFLILSFPVGAALLLSGITTLFFVAPDIPFTIVAQRFIYGTDVFSFIAVPMFMVAGLIMNSSGITKKLISFSNSLVGHLHGGLSHVNILVSMLFAGMSGSAVADCSSLGTVLIPTMVDEGYEPEFAAAVTASSSTVGPIIPPSIGMVILGLVVGMPVGRLFLGGAIPGFLMGLYMLIVSFIISKKRNYPTMARSSLKEIWSTFRQAFLALITPVLIVGAIIFGVATPTEAAVVGVFYSLFLGLFVYKTIKLKDLPALLISTGKMTASIMFIVGAAGLFGWIIAWSGVQENMIIWANSIAAATSPIIVIVLMNVFLLIMGCFLSVVANILIWGPTLIPVAASVGFDPFHFAIIMILNLHIGLVTPPVGIAMYIVTKIANISIDSFVKENMIFLLMLLLALATVIAFPQLVHWLPNLLM